ncbi:MAG: uroporphyrinogen-III synthase [Ferruginibacter sp.]|nr:uroporphyrinogen-III synthase [Ferruginibacter sp.]
MQNNISILCTRPLSKALVEQAQQQGIIIDEIAFIATAAIQTIEVQQEIEQVATQTTTVVFTSMNAVEAVAGYLHGQPVNWRIYCMGTTTNQLVKKYFGEQQLAGIANSAAELAELIAANILVDELTFFCGDQRRDELPEILSSYTIDVTEIVVYQTIAVNHVVNKIYNGILFFSPSAAESFFSKNKLPAATVLFAIGSTTANEIKKYSTNKIITSSEPGKENLVAKMMEYFT